MWEIGNRVGSAHGQELVPPIGNPARRVVLHWRQETRPFPPGSSQEARATLIKKVGGRTHIKALFVQSLTYPANPRAATAVPAQPTGTRDSHLAQQAPIMTRTFRAAGATASMGRPQARGGRFCQKHWHSGSVEFNGVATA